MLPSRLRTLLVPFASLTFTFLVGAPVVARSRMPAQDIVPRRAPVAPAYTVTDVGVLPGYSDSAAYAINARGQVAGSAYKRTRGAERDRAFRTSAAGTLATRSADLGTLPGYSDSVATAINDRGQVAGFAYKRTRGAERDHAFRTSATGGLASPGVDLGSLSGAPGYNDSVAYGINARGQVVGYAIAADGIDHAFRTSATGGLASPGVDLGTLPGGSSSTAHDINDRGQVVGLADTAGRDVHAFRVGLTATLASPRADLGSLPGGSPAFSEANGINACGQAVGDATAADGQVHAFRLGLAGTLAARGADLGTLPGDNNSEALAINDRGQVVGDAYDTTPDGLERRLRAFLYDDAARPRLRDLNSLIPAHSGVVLERATGINDAGQIAAIGTVHGHTHAFRLTPLRPPHSTATTAITPEPTTMVTPTTVPATAPSVAAGTTPTPAGATGLTVAPTMAPYADGTTVAHVTKRGSGHLCL